MAISARSSGSSKRLARSSTPPTSEPKWYDSVTPKLTSTSWPTGIVTLEGGSLSSNVDMAGGGFLKFNNLTRAVLVLTLLLFLVLGVLR